MSRIPIGLQLYSVREDCAKDLPGTLKAVAKMGYEGVDFAGYYNYPAAELRTMLDDLGLVCCGHGTLEYREFFVEACRVITVVVVVINLRIACAINACDFVVASVRQVRSVLIVRNTDDIAFNC